MKMKIPVSLVLLLAVFFSAVGCARFAPAENRTAADPATDAVEETADETAGTEEAFTYSVFPAGVISIENGTAVYNDGRITFRWDTGEWFLSEENDMPVLVRTEGLPRVSFCIYDCIDGVPGSLWTFSAAALQKAIPAYEFDRQFFAFVDNDSLSKDWIGITSGYYLHDEEEPSDLLTYVHSVSNGVHSCVYGVRFTSAGKNEIADLYEDFCKQQDAEVLEKYVRPILDSFSLLK